MSKTDRTEIKEIRQFLLEQQDRMDPKTYAIFLKQVQATLPALADPLIGKTVPGRMRYGEAFTFFRSPLDFKQITKGLPIVFGASGTSSELEVVALEFPTGITDPKLIEVADLDRYGESDNHPYAFRAKMPGVPNKKTAIALNEMMDSVWNWDADANEDPIQAEEGVGDTFYKAGPKWLEHNFTN